MAINPESLKKATGAYFDELKYVMARIPDFPALVELITRLTGKDRKTCELALYTLKKQDERLAKKDGRIAELEKIVSMADEDAAMMLAKKDRRIAELEKIGRMADEHAAMMLAKKDARISELKAELTSEQGRADRIARELDALRWEREASAEYTNQMRKALKPFSDAALYLDENDVGAIYDHPASENIGCNDLRAARAALEKKNG